MNSLTSRPVAQVLERLHQDAEDRELVAAMMAVLEAPGVTMDTVVAKLLVSFTCRARQQSDPDRRVWNVHGHLDHLSGCCAPG